MITYILKFIACSGLLILFYRLFLEREKMHQFNRWFLLISIVFALAVPLISVELKQIQPAAFPVEAYSPINEIDQVISMPIRDQSTEITLDWMPYLPSLIYLIISGVLLFRLARNLNSILSQRSKNNTIVYAGSQLVLVPSIKTTYSFLDYIFVNKTKFEQKQIEHEVLMHELAHVRQRHSLDIIFMELIQTFLWINPFLIFYKKSIQLNHEFLADDAVLRVNADIKSYQLILLSHVAHSQTVNLASSFNYSITKQRLIMMTKRAKRSNQIWRQLSIAVLVAGLVFAFCEKIYSQEKSAPKAKKEIPSPKPEKSKVSETPRAFNYKTPGPGLTDTEWDEFNKTMDQYATYVTNKKGRTDAHVDMSIELKNRMYLLFCKMNDEQHKKTNVSCFQMPIPVKEFPTEKVFESWKDPNVFGVWIDNKKVPNSELDKYKASDIAEFWSSKLYGAAKKGRIYKYQLDLTTDARFEKTYQKRVKDRIVIVRSVPFKG